MNIILSVIIPTLCLLTLGNVLRRTDFLPTDFWNSADKLTYFVLFPALLITKISQVNLGDIPFGLVAVFITLYFLITSGVSFAVYRTSHSKAKQFSSIFQGILRFNSYIYFAIIIPVLGNEAGATAAVIAGLAIPIVNVLSVASFAVTNHHFSMKNMLKSMGKNPLIIGCFLGFIVNQAPVIAPKFALDTLYILSVAALPLALLSVGASVRIKTLLAKQSDFSPITLWFTALTRLVVSPALAWALAYLLGIEGILLQIIVIFAAVPTATSSFILSKQLGGDTDMMVSIISLETILSMITLSVWILLLI